MIADLPRRRRVALAAAVALIVLIVMIGPYLGSYYGLSNSRALAEIKATQQTNQQLLQNQQYLLQIIHQATSPAVEQQNAAQLAKLIGCLYNRIDFDNGLIKRLDPNCTPAKIATPATRANAPSVGGYIVTTAAFRGDGPSATNTQSAVPATSGVPGSSPRASRPVSRPSQPSRTAAPSTPPGRLISNRHRAPSLRGRTGRTLRSAPLPQHGPSRPAPHH